MSAKGNAGASRSRIEEEIARIEKLRKTRKNVTLFAAPVTTLVVFIYVIRDGVISAINYIQYHKKLFSFIALLLSAAVALYFAPGAHQLHIDTIEQVFLLSVWWVGLGVLSSIGLGTGLHTFVLYLGPYIAKVTLTATECNTINFDETGPNSFVCPPGEGSGVTYWEILQKVQMEALLWGIGTAIGELPPYFVARTARLSGLRLEEEEETSNSIISRLKNYVPSIVNNLGFFAILAFASIPNPLFDLAGITCGHCLVPFWKFFGATLIGKAFIKAHIQTIFVITVFHKEHLALVVSELESWIPFLRGKIMPIFDKERARLHRTGTAVNEPAGKTMLQWAWDTVLISMLAYFLISIVNSSVQEYLIRKDEEEITKLKGQFTKTSTLHHFSI
eukprot:Phypoly_transcript_08114.p1 GENE.Phypoly_transcript_08114~~Phypoly_transcript_08114.p1  ORF type:complete len:390 (+),score=55.10 Phypoly_transcript_08114:68-1237(+)